MELSNADIPEDRIKALELKIRNLDALVKGLVEEALDLKPVVMTLSRRTGEMSRQELSRTPVIMETKGQEPAESAESPASSGSPAETMVIRPKSKSQPDVLEEPEMVRIMQPDGTMKMEPRKGDQKMFDTSKETRRMTKGPQRGRK
jgi:hypothetical protein